MVETNKIQLKIESIKEVPINTYVEDFIFFVNGQEFRTNGIFSELLLSKICRIHLIDPTFDQMTINTKNEGDFSKFLKLDKFEKNEIQDEELLFYNEIIEELGHEHFSITEIEQNQEEITEENIFHTTYSSSSRRIFIQE